VRFDVGIEQFGVVYSRRLNYAIWTGAAIHVDGVAGDDMISLMQKEHSKRPSPPATPRAKLIAFWLSRSTTEATFPPHVNDMPNQPVAVISWAGQLRYRAVLSIAACSDARMKARWAGVSQRSSVTGVALYRVKRTLSDA